jgi:hypothetical protein
MKSEGIQDNCFGEDFTTLKARFAEIVNSFLQDISFQIPNQRYDLTLEQRIVDRMRSENFPPDFIQRLSPAIHNGIAQAVIYYPYLTAEVQDAIALYVSYLVILDETCHEIKPDLKSFSKNLLSGQPQDNKLLQCISVWLRSASDLFGTFAGNMMIKDAFNFTAAMVLEDCLQLPSDATHFSEYFRQKTGGAETWALFAFPENIYPEDKFLSTYLPAIPALVAYLNHVNDLLSFYKEARDGETTNCVSTYAMTHNMTPLQVLELYPTKLKEQTQEIRAILSKEPQMQEHVEQFLQGFLFGHLAAPRYRLCELDIPAAQAAMEYCYGKK